MMLIRIGILLYLLKQIRCEMGKKMDKMGAGSDPAGGKCKLYIGHNLKGKDFSNI